MAFETIDVQRGDGVCRITLNRPDRLNSINELMHRELGAALDEVSSQVSIRALLITGAGRAFCAGQDLSDRVRGPEDPPPDLGESLDKRYNPLIRRLHALELPVVCAVNGTAAGAGANLALACDIVLAARSARFIESFCRVGLIPDSGGSWVLPRLVGAARARALAMLGEPVTAEQAEAWGMIWRCVADESLPAEAQALCARLARQATRGLALTKRALRESWSNTLDAQLDLERDLQREAGRSDDYREGVAAFMEKREPVFRGR